MAVSKASMEVTLASDDVDHLVGVGCELSDEGDHINAARCFQRALDLEAEWVAFNLGNELVALGRDQDAIELYERALGAGESDAWLNLGQVLERLGDLAGALHAYARGQAAGDANAGLQRAFLLRETDHRAEAEAVVQQLAADGSATADAVAACWLFDRTNDVSLEPRLRAGADRFPSARADLALLLRDTGRVEQALEVLRHGVARGERESFLPLGNLLADHLNDPAAAEETYRAGIAAGDHYCHHNLAALLRRQGRIDEALEHYALAAAAGDQLALQALTDITSDDEDD